MANVLDLLLEDVQVEPPGTTDAPEVNGPKTMRDWWAVSTSELGIIAYFANEADACRFRLDYINGLLNPVPPDGVDYSRWEIVNQ